MSRGNNINSSSDEEKILAILKFLGILFLVLLIVFVIKISIQIYNPKERELVNNSRYAYDKIQLQLTKIYKKQGYIFRIEGEKINDLCAILGKEYSKYGTNCNDDFQGHKKNFTFDDTKIEVWGLEKKAFPVGNVLVKDFFIDVNGRKGENQIGIDRIPLRIYSEGRMGGIITPVNCKKDDEIEYDISRSSLCGNLEINYLDTPIPFGYDVMQIGGNHGKTVLLNRDVPFLRADCAAFGGDMIAGDLCTDRGYSWLSACYDEVPCATQLTKN